MTQAGSHPQDLDDFDIPDWLLGWLLKHKHALAGDSELQVQADGSYRLRWRGVPDQAGHCRRRYKTITHDPDVAKAVKRLLAKWKAEERRAAVVKRKMDDRVRQTKGREASLQEAEEDLLKALIADNSQVKQRALLRAYRQVVAQGPLAKFLFGLQLDLDTVTPRIGRTSKGEIG